MNNRKLLISSILLIMVLGVFTYRYMNIRKTDAYKFKKEYESVNGEKHGDRTIRTLNIPIDNPMKYSTAEKIIRKINAKETFIVYFGFKECPWCRSIIENLISVAKEKNIDTIYYVDVKDIRDVKEYKDGQVVTTNEGTKSYKKLVELLEPVLSDYTIQDENKEEISAGEKRIYAPNIVAISSGKPEKMTEAISKKLTDPYMKLTKKINNDSKNQIKCLFKCIEKSNVCTSSTSC